MGAWVAGADAQLHLGGGECGEGSVRIERYERGAWRNCGHGGLRLHDLDAGGGEGGTDSVVAGVTVQLEAARTLYERWMDLRMSARA